MGLDNVEVLFLCHRIPYPPNKGEKIRAWHILSHLSTLHDVHLGCLVDDPQEFSYRKELSNVVASLGCFGIRPTIQKARALTRIYTGRPLSLDFFYNRGLQRWVDEKLSRHSIQGVYVYSSAMATYLDQTATADCVRVMDMVDIDSEKWRTYASHCSWPLRRLYEREGDALFAFEKHVASRFDKTLFVSEAEATRFAELAPECRSRVGWLENGVDLDWFSEKGSSTNPYVPGTDNIVFTGTMDYWPNVDAVTWFANHIFPRIRQRRPRAQFHVVGAKPTRAVLRLRRLSNVHVTGRVPDVRPYLSHARVAVAPLRIARGVQNKILEAMAMGLPVVATPEAFEGLRGVAGRDLLVARRPDEMASVILVIIEGGHAGVGEAARQAVERNYRWSETLQPLDSLFQRLLKQHGSCTETHCH